LCKWQGASKKSDPVERKHLAYYVTDENVVQTWETGSTVDKLIDVCLLW